MNVPSDGAYVGKHAGSFKDEPEPQHYSWWEILRDPWYIVLIMLGIGLGSRLAGGCTSGHMMSGIMQTSLSGYLFAAGAFAAGIPTAILLFKREA